MSVDCLLIGLAAKAQLARTTEEPLGMVTKNE